MIENDAYLPLRLPKSMLKDLERIARAMEKRDRSYVAREFLSDGIKRSKKSGVIK